jgi:acetyltransferase-like isoleucine patch superfamily enzyme
MIKTNPVAYARSVGVKVGKDVRLIGITDKTFESEPYLISIGDHVTIAGQVKFINHDGGVWIFRESERNIELIKKICVKNNVFIGYRSIILPGVTIGNNVIIGAGSVVASDIPDNCVAAGVPAKVIRTIEEYRNKIDPYIVKRTWKNTSEKESVLRKHFNEEE